MKPSATMSPRETPPRKLVSLQRVSRIERLPSSETREVVMIEGWPVVRPRGEFTLNQLVLYFKIDSFLPFDDERFEAYRSSQVSAERYGEKGWVVQTVTIRRPRFTGNGVLHGGFRRGQRCQGTH